MNSMNGMVIDGVFASETPDSSGEILIISGCDISDLQNGTAILNFEHRGQDAPGHSPLDIIGKIIFAKKIYSAKDCEDDRQTKYWNQLKVPFIYGQARLFDGAGHPGALAAAAMIRDQASNNEKILLRYSIEGSTLERKGSDLLRSVARRVAATIKPCNRSCDSGIISDPQGQDGAIKSAEVLAEKLLGTDKKEESTKKFELDLSHPGYTKLGHSPELEIEAGYLDLQNMSKALTGGMASGAPSTLTGSDALARADRAVSSKRKPEESSTEETKAIIKKAIKAKLLSKALEGASKFGAPRDHDDGGKFVVMYKNNDGQSVVADQTTYSKVAREKGNKLKAGKDKMTSSYLDMDTGTIHTPYASVKVAIPNEKDDPEFFQKLDETEPLIKQAVYNWSILNDHIKKGTLPPEVLLHSTALSAFSPQTPIQSQERALSHLYDMIQEGEFDPRKGYTDKEYEGIRSKFYERTKKEMPHPKRITPEVWEAEGKQKGQLNPSSKIEPMFHYPTLGPMLEKLVGRYQNGHDTLHALLAMKAIHKKFKKTPERIPQAMQAAGLGDFAATPVHGFSPKTLRYILGMIGYGDMHVADTHFTRHISGSNTDDEVNRRVQAALQRSNSHNKMLRDDNGQVVMKNRRVKVGEDKEGNPVFDSVPEPLTKYVPFLPHDHIEEVLQDPKMFQLQQQLDHLYAKHYPTVPRIQKMLKEMTGKDYGAHEVVFPAFWWHWISGPQHELARGYNDPSDVQNGGAIHPTFWHIADRVLRQNGLPNLWTYPDTKPSVIKSEGDSVAQRTAAAQAQMQQMLGEGGASLFYYTHLVPVLLKHGGVAKKEKSKESSSAGSSAEETETSWSKKPTSDGMPKVSEEFIETFEDVADDIGKVPLKVTKKMNKSELWMHELFLRSKLAKTEESKPESDGVTEKQIHPEALPEAKKLVVGMKMIPKKVTGVNRTGGAMADVSFWAENIQNHPMYVKGETSDSEGHANGEAATSRLAHDLGLGEFFPHSALVQSKDGNKAVIEGVVNMDMASFLPPSIYEEFHQKQNPADLQKLALFDAITSNNDRHDSNYGFKPDGKIVMFDHGDNFQHHLIEPGEKVLMPDYLKHMRDMSFDPEAVKWFQGVDPQKFATTLQKYGVTDSKVALSQVMRNIERLKRTIQNPKTTVGDLFLHID